MTSYCDSFSSPSLENLKEKFYAVYQKPNFGFLVPSGLLQVLQGIGLYGIG